MSRSSRLKLVAGLIGSSLLACTPIITIGYGEILILILIVGVVVGPIFYRFFRTRSKTDQRKGDQEQK